MAYHIVIRKNGKQQGLLGPYATKPAADADANAIKIRLSAPASVVVEKVKVGGVTYVPQGGGAATAYTPPAYTPPPLRRAAGGVVINEDGFILVREPTNHFDGYVWTLPKGGVDAGETDEQGALREVLEETGIRAEAVAPIPGEWKGGTSTNVYFLMRPVEDTGAMDNETQNIAFVSYDDAKVLISKTKNAKGKARDLEVLDAGYGLWLHRRQAAAATPKRNRRRHSFA